MQRQAQPSLTLDVMEFLEESKRMERYKAREQLLEAVERVSVTKARETHSYRADFGGLEDRTVHDIKRDMIAAVKSVLG